MRMFNKDRIINFDSQGFPLEEQTLKDIIEQICSYDEKTNRYYIDADDKTLNIVPRVQTTETRHEKNLQRHLRK